MALTDKEIAAGICYRLLVAAKRGRSSIFVNDGEFVRTCPLQASNTRKASVLGRLVRDGRICRSREWQTHPDSMDRPVTYWLPSNPVPEHVRAYRR